VITHGSKGNKTYTARWDLNSDTKYTVEHYQEQIDGGYELVDTDILGAETNSTVTAERKNYKGFILPPVQTVTVVPN
jgi:hypothetical protein